MAFNEIKLDKALYRDRKGFTNALEGMDPTEAYKGTELQGLDAYERQLKRFDIKVKGGDSISKFFQTSESAALFPEYVSRAVLQGLDEANFVDRLVAVTTTTDSLDYRSIESAPTDDERELAIVGEGAFIPETRVRVKEELTQLYKRGRMLTASYEALKYQKLDLFTVTLNQIGAYIAKAQMQDLINVILGSSVDTVSTESDEITYADLVGLWAEFPPYSLTTLVANPATIKGIIDLAEFKDSTAGQNFHGTGKMVTPFGAEIIATSAVDDGVIIALDRNSAIEKVQLGGVETEYDKLIDRQIERAAITVTAGFSVIFSDAIKILNVASGE